MAKGCAIAFVVVCMGIAILCGLGGYAIREGARRAAEIEANMTPEERAAKQKQQEERNADLDTQVAAKRAVLSALKAPDTAKVVIQKHGKFSEHGWGASGEVTAQNSFGVPLRQSFEVRFYRPDNAKGASAFRLAYIRIDDSETKYSEVMLLLEADRASDATDAHR